VNLVTPPSCRPGTARRSPASPARRRAGRRAGRSPTSAAPAPARLRQPVHITRGPPPRAGAAGVVGLVARCGPCPKELPGHPRPPAVLRPW
jgi:hypothetical protein